MYALADVFCVQTNMQITIEILDALFFYYFLKKKKWGKHTTQTDNENKKFICVGDRYMVNQNKRRKFY